VHYLILGEHVACSVVNDVGRLTGGALVFRRLRHGPILPELITSQTQASHGVATAIPKISSAITPPPTTVMTANNQPHTFRHGPGQTASVTGSRSR
jgi:hypothetical protein